ncbi:MAG: cytidylate kinase-like family protein [Proteobacteria bacterium]|nr:cytidylate kinase-like family protein [Pseudomonadota bacterium]MBU1450991.1 cytidylate kinase-like family protein [Pseudomonadota bacterium]MBU2470416.1 cytidylate kinase-like family protein [Pseudomonadota bacterium]MBU2516431.1 cytidylate kinase-like family protein [Pseudomonadota bacterium]
MPVIIVSADDFQQGREIAHRVAGVLGYRFLGRDLLARVAQEKQVSQQDLARALDEPPGLLSRRSRRQRLLSEIEAACLEQLLEDNVVAYGLAAHLYVRGVSHVLKVRIINEPEQRANILAQTGNIPLERARKLAQRQTGGERRWSQDAYQLDQTDPSLYDMVLSLGTLEQDKAVEIICDMVGYRKFQPMTYSRKCLRDKALAAQVRLALMERFPDIRVEANDGTVVAYIQSLKKDQRKKQEQVRQMAGELPGVRHVEVHVIRDYFGQAAQSSR